MERKVLMMLIVAAVMAAGTAFARGPWRADEGNTRGWELMSPQERIAHQAKIRSFANYEDCRKYQLVHHQQMEERARRKGLQLRQNGRDACEDLYQDTPRN